MMAEMHPAACPPGTNAGERAVFAACTALLDAAWVVWWQVALPGREAPGRRNAPLRADFVLLGPSGLVALEVKGWRAAAIAAVDENRITFRNGRAVPHPLLQAYRYAAGLTQRLRVAGVPGVPVRHAVALPFVHDDQLAAVDGGAALRGPRIVTADALGPGLGARLDGLPPAGPPLGPATRAALVRLLARAGDPPPAHTPPLFDL